MFNTLTCFINGRLANSKAPGGGHKTSHLTSFCATVNSYISPRVLFLRNFADAEFRENKAHAKWRKRALSFSDVGNHAKVANF